MHNTKHGYTHYATLLALGLMALSFLVACASPVSGATGGTHQTQLATVTPQVKPQQSPTTTLTAVLPLIQKFIQVERQLHTAHVTIQAKGTIQSGGAWLPAIAKESTYTVIGKGAVDLTKGQEHLHVHGFITSAGKQLSTFQASEVLAGQRLYFQTGASSTWFVINLKDINTLVPTNGIAASQPQDLLQLAQHVSVIDHGIVMNNKQRVHHITLTLDQQGIIALSKVIQQPMLQQPLTGVQILTPVSADLFLDEKTALLQQINLHGKVIVNADTFLTAFGKNAPSTGGQAATSHTITLQFDTSILMSKLNQPISIQLPAHTTSLTLTTNANQP